ncbi:MAG: mercuric transporter MerT family protein [Gemmataceae bacterium]
MTVETQTETKTARRVECPSCGKKAKQVRTVTLGALLKEEFAKRFTADGHSCCGTTGEGCQPINGDTGWRFCDSQDCDVVYFSEEGDTTFTKSQLKVPVGVKEQAGDRPLCYCFGHSVASIKKELRTKGRSDALEDIRAKMKVPGCRCERENPSGSCCLGSVAKGIKIAQEELNMLDSGVQTPANPAKVASLPGAGTGQPQHNGQLAVADIAPSVSAKGGQPKEKGAFLATLGAIFTAILGSACCWLPLLLIAFGFSAAGVGTFFEQYRPYFLTVTFALLGVAWYFAYRAAIWRAWARLRGKPAPVLTVEACCASEATSAPAHSCCGIEAEPEPADCCAPGAKAGAGQTIRRRFTMRQFNQVMLWMATVMIVLFALFPHWIGLFLGGGGSNSTAALNAEDNQRVVLEIQGMTCEGCAPTAEKALRSVPGVSAAAVSYEKKQAVVFVPKGQEVPRDAILQAARQAGYSATFRK